MKRSTWLWAGGGAAVAVGLIAWAFAPRPIEVEVADATQGRFEATIDEDAKTRLRERYVVSAPLAGQLARIALREGDAVAADAVVATLAPTLSPMLDERTLREQRLRVEIAEAQAQRVDARSESAKVALHKARNELRRTEQLAREGFVAPTRLDTDRLAAQAAQKELDAAMQERHVAGHEVEQARAALSAVRSPDRPGSRHFALRSPTAGRVLRIVQPSETTVALGTPLIELGDTQGLEVVAELLTADALQVRPGTAVAIERWGGDAPLEGRVRLIEPAGFTKVSALGVEEQRVKVVIDIASRRDRWTALGDGYRVGVRIVTLAADDVVKVPVSAVFPLPKADPGAMAVFTVQAGRARITPVQVGGRNGVEAWIKNGLARGATVIIYPPGAVKDGVRVKPQGV